MTFPWGYAILLVIISDRIFDDEPVIITTQSLHSTVSRTSGNPTGYFQPRGSTAGRGGIPAKYPEPIFRIFKRLHTRDSYGGGTGVGLTMTRRIIERHNGKIWLESTEHQGTTFYFTLEG
jgi:light-regulated signal transduction histidine kinase (bacteriophytochrome)